MIGTRLKVLFRPIYQRVSAIPMIESRAYRMAVGARYRRWCAANPCPTSGDRMRLYQHVLETQGLGGPIDYLEFGVWEGESLRWWLERNAHPDSSFVGFDSFEGLPDAWGGMPAGSFSTSGRLPEISDPRCRFVKGYFQETLPGWLAGQELGRRLVVHLDADLYGSTLFVLLQLSPRLKPGDLLLFDEFSSYLHEFRALEDALVAFPMSLRALGKTPDWMQLALEVL